MPNTPFPGLRPAGFAVVDINNDGIPELVLLCGCCQELVALYTLHDDAPVMLVIGGASRFGFSIAADGTIFGMTAAMDPFFLRSCRLEPGAAELTQITRSTLLFEDNTLWHANNGQRREITEEEFYALLERYENPSNPMPLEFIPIINEREEP